MGETEAPTGQVQVSSSEEAWSKKNEEWGKQKTVLSSVPEIYSLGHNEFMFKNLWIFLIGVGQMCVWIKLWVWSIPPFLIL